MSRHLVWLPNFDGHFVQVLARMLTMGDEISCVAEICLSPTGPMDHSLSLCVALPTLLGET